ncbi:MAG: hypothetical protein JWN30_2218 [Bacilli bacterium]|nr:hypothetical protein [Bacilli bacterium]
MHAFLPNLLCLEIMIGGLYILSVYNFVQIRAMFRNRQAHPAQLAASRAHTTEFSSSPQPKRVVA